MVIQEYEVLVDCNLQYIADPDFDSTVGPDYKIAFMLAGQQVYMDKGGMGSLYEEFGLVVNVSGDGSGGVIF